MGLTVYTRWKIDITIQYSIAIMYNSQREKVLTTPGD